MKNAAKFETTIHEKRTSVAFGSSLGFHLLLLIILALSSKGPERSEPLEVSIIETKMPDHILRLEAKKPRVIPTKVNPQSSAKNIPTSGISRDSTVDTKDPDAPIAKIGNTLSKAPDQLPSNDEGLPPAAGDFEITSWPALQNDVRVVYPREAKARGVEGVVVMELYINEAGDVKSAKFISGPGQGLNEAALSAARTFKFSPAKIGREIVPVIIKYSYKFVIQK